MTTPRLYTYYPPEYSEMFLRAARTPITLTFSTTFDADRTRKTLYAFRTAIKNSRKERVVAAEALQLIAPLLSFKLSGTNLIISRPLASAVAAKMLRKLQKGED